MTLQLKIVRALSRSPRTADELAAALKVPRSEIMDGIRRLRDTRHVEAFGRVSQTWRYRLTGKPFTPAMADARQRRKPKSEHRMDGYGAEPCTLQEVWGI